MLEPTEFTILGRDTLPFDGKTYEFQGALYGDTQVSFIWVEMPVGGGVKLHRHPYQEIFIIQEGMATFTVGSATLQAHAGQIIIVPPGTSHKFTNSGDRLLRQVDIHASRIFITEWLEE
jgi:mannose-6-phosphate isomerase-like protein (cupin superfamily)